MLVRSLVVIACLSGLVPAANAAPRWLVGGKGGANVAELSGDGVDNAKNRNAFDGGVYFGAEFTPHFGARVEGLFVGKGATGSITTPGDGHPHDATWTLDMLEVPIVAIGRIPVGSNMNVGAFAGPTFAFPLTSEIQTSHGLENLDAGTEDFEFGGTVGGEVQYSFDPLAVVADVRYSAGFTSVVADIGGQSVDVTTRGFGARLGLQYLFGTP